MGKYTDFVDYSDSIARAIVRRKKIQALAKDLQDLFVEVRLDKEEILEAVNLALEEPPKAAI